MSKCTPQDMHNLMTQFCGGSDQRFRHWANGGFIYTLGLQQVAEMAGAYWLLDIIATECAPILHRMWQAGNEHMLVFMMRVHENRTAEMQLDRDGEWQSADTPILWQREIEFTDFPAGDWQFIRIRGLHFAHRW